MMPASNPNDRIQPTPDRFTPANGDGHHVDVRGPHSSTESDSGAIIQAAVEQALAILAPKVLTEYSHFRNLLVGAAKHADQLDSLLREAAGLPITRGRLARFYKECNIILSGAIISDGSVMSTVSSKLIDSIRESYYYDMNFRARWHVVEQATPTQTAKFLEGLSSDLCSCVHMRNYALVKRGRKRISPAVESILEGVLSELDESRAYLARLLKQDTDPKDRSGN
jgi:hypothetical protein